MKIPDKYFPVVVYVRLLVNILFKRDYPVICHQTLSLQLFDLPLYDVCCLLIIIDFTTVLHGILAKREMRKQNHK